MKKELNNIYLLLCNYILKNNLNIEGGDQLEDLEQILDIIYNLKEGEL